MKDLKHKVKFWLNIKIYNLKIVHSRKWTEWPKVNLVNTRIFFDSTRLGTARHTKSLRSCKADNFFLPYVTWMFVYCALNCTFTPVSKFQIKLFLKFWNLSNNFFKWFRKKLLFFSIKDTSLSRYFNKNTS